jgi:hypothetical protein
VESVYSVWRIFLLKVRQGRDDASNKQGDLMSNLCARGKQYRAIASAAMQSVTLALVARCGDSNSVSETPPGTSPGTVVGQVVSFATSAPVSGATVKTTSSTTTTASDGKFSVSAPAGDRTLVRVEATGFA